MAARQLKISDMAGEDVGLRWDLAQAQFMSYLCSTGSLLKANGTLPANGQLSTGYTKAEREIGWYLTKAIFHSLLPVVSTMRQDGDLGSNFPNLSADTFKTFLGLLNGRSAASLLRDELVIFKECYFESEDDEERLDINNAFDPQSLQEEYNLLFSYVSGSDTELEYPEVQTIKLMQQMIKNDVEWSLTQRSMAGRPELFLFPVMALRFLRYSSFGLSEFEFASDEDEGKKAFDQDSDMLSVRTEVMDRDLKGLLKYLKCDPIGHRSVGSVIRGFGRK